MCTIFRCVFLSGLAFYLWFDGVSMWFYVSSFFLSVCFAFFLLIIVNIVQNVSFNSFANHLVEFVYGFNLSSSKMCKTNKTVFRWFFLCSNDIAIKIIFQRNSSPFLFTHWIHRFRWEKNAWFTYQLKFMMRAHKCHIDWKFVTENTNTTLAIRNNRMFHEKLHSRKINSNYW